MMASAKAERMQFPVQLIVQLAGVQELMLPAVFSLANLLYARNMAV
jgi:hypothetical protein